MSDEEWVITFIFLGSKWSYKAVGSATVLSVSLSVIGTNPFSVDEISLLFRTLKKRSDNIFRQIWFANSNALSQQLTPRHYLHTHRTRLKHQPLSSCSYLRVKLILSQTASTTSARSGRPATLSVRRVTAATTAAVRLLPLTCCTRTSDWQPGTSAKGT